MSSPDWKKHDAMAAQLFPEKVQNQLKMWAWIIQDYVSSLWFISLPRQDIVKCDIVEYVGRWSLVHRVPSQNHYFAPTPRFVSIKVPIPWKGSLCSAFSPVTVHSAAHSWWHGLGPEPVWLHGIIVSHPSYLELHLCSIFNIEPGQHFLFCAAQREV